MLQLNPQIPVIAKGRSAQALAWFDYSEEHDLLWLVAFDDDAACWLIPNKEIRLFMNYSIGRNVQKDEITIARKEGDSPF